MGTEITGLSNERYHLTTLPAVDIRPSAHDQVPPESPQLSATLLSQVSTIRTSADGDLLDSSLFYDESNNLKTNLVCTLGREPSSANNAKPSFILYRFKTPFSFTIKFSLHSF